MATSSSTLNRIALYYTHTHKTIESEVLKKLSLLWPGDQWRLCQSDIQHKRDTPQWTAAAQIVSDQHDLYQSSNHKKVLDIRLPQL